MINSALVLSPFLRTNLTALLNATTDQTLMLLWLILVDLSAHGLDNLLAVLYWDRNLHAFGLLEPVALGWVLGPNLASIAILLPELLTNLLLLVRAFLLVLSVVSALLTEIYRIINAKTRLRHIPSHQQDKCKMMYLYLRISVVALLLMY